MLRHGESTGNAEDRLQGQQDYPLSPGGQVQAQQLADEWRGKGIRFERILASPLLRALQTAEMIASTLDIPLDVVPEWRERGFGTLEGLRWEEVRRIKPRPDFYNLHYRPGETGEALLELVERAAAALEKTLQKDECNLLVVTHGAILTAALYHILGILPGILSHSKKKPADPPLPVFRLGNLAYAQITFEPERSRWSLFGLVNPLVRFGTAAAVPSSRVDP